MDVLSNAELTDIERICPGSVIRDADLSQISRWKVGGPAKAVIRPKSTEQVAALRQYFYRVGRRHIVIGSTSNLLFDDKGLTVPCIQLGDWFGTTRFDGEEIFAEAGIWVPKLARKIAQAGLVGTEHICGIPGTLGGLICMNGGSQRKGIGTHIVHVESVDSHGGIKLRSADECLFSYRQSIFQSNDEIITAATLRVPAGDKKNSKKEILKILRERRLKFPRKHPNCGSVFKSNPSMYSIIGPPGAAIEKIGLKGHQIGGAKISEKHANFIINTGKATASDILELIRLASDSVYDNTGFRMESEVYYVRPDGTLITAANVTKKNPSASFQP